MGDVLMSSMSVLADTSGAVTAMRDYVAPTIRTLAALAAIACTFFMVNSGYLYMASSGQPDKMAHAKHILRNAVLGLVIVLSAATLTSLLTHAYGSPHHVANAALPNLQAIPPADVSNGLIDVLIKAVTGFLNNIIQAVAAPFLVALDYFTKATPLMAENSSVFNLWLAIVGMTDVLFAVILALIGFHVMSAASFGFDEIEFKHLLPRIGLVFLLLNTSIFAIDGIVELSNALIIAIGKVSGASSVWETLTSVVKESGGQGLAGLLMMLAFLIFSVILLVYYVGRLVTLFIGAVLSPLVVLVWLVPGFRDFSETAIKTYISTIFVLFVHVVILQLAASLFTGMSVTSGNNVPDTLMAMVVGLATVMALLKTQSVMMQFSYVSMGARNARQLGGQFMNGVSYMTSKGKAGVSAVSNKVTNKSTPSGTKTGGGRTTVQGTSYKHPSSAAKGVTVTRVPAEKQKTGTTYEAPKAIPRDNVMPLKSKTATPKNSSKDKVV
ncbi:hypothetical protein BH09PAT4_BH09PAT4_00080 [soil metagenome]